MIEHSGEDCRLLLTKSPGVTWVRDSLGVILTNPDKKVYTILPGLEADLWEYLVLNRPFHELIFLICNSLGGTQDEARTYLGQMITKLDIQGFVSLEAEVE